MRKFLAELLKFANIKSMAMRTPCVDGNWTSSGRNLSHIITVTTWPTNQKPSSPNLPDELFTKWRTPGPWTSDFHRPRLCAHASLLTKLTLALGNSTGVTHDYQRAGCRSRSLKRPPWNFNLHVEYPNQLKMTFITSKYRHFALQIVRCNGKVPTLGNLWR